MNQENYNCSITANVSMNEAFESISKGVPKWWTKNFEGASQNVNDVFTVSFGDTFVTMKISEVIPDKKIVWLVTDSLLPWLKNKNEWTDTQIIWEFSGANNFTHINMTHVGLSPEVECYTNCEKGWDFYVKKSLFKLLTEHKGLPDTAGSAREEIIANSNQ